jgi:glycosyltransferase involved in cell wall biosynthesis
VICVRVLIFHGYLLRGTGSNVYNAELARSLVALGHEVHLFCQEQHAAQFDFVDAVGRWHDGRLSIYTVREPVRCTAYLPDIGELLPVYVADHYEDFDARTYPELTDHEIERYIAANVSAVREVAAAVRPDVVLANHLVMGPVILARAVAGEIPFSVKIHGSALEYTVRPNLARFGRYAEEGLRSARTVLVGSRHTARSLWDVAAMPDLPSRTCLLPPGVDTNRFVPRSPAQARRRLWRLTDQLEESPPMWGGEASGAAALRAADPVHECIVTYVGKLIVSKGVDLLIAAWPLVFADAPTARLMIAGFGNFRHALVELVGALGDGDVAAAREIASRGRELEGGPSGELRYLASFLDGLGPAERARYINAAAPAMQRVHFVGRLDHADVSELMSASDAVVVPSTFPEAFGMVLAEAACCGAVPLSAAHSGLAEVNAEIAPAVDENVRSLLSFELGPAVVRQIAGDLARCLALAADKPDDWQQVRACLARVARARFGWEQVASGITAAAEGRLASLSPAAVSLAARGRPPLSRPHPPGGPAACRTRSASPARSTPARSRARGTVPASASKIPSSRWAGRRAFFPTPEKPRSTASRAEAPSRDGRPGRGLGRGRSKAAADTPTVARLCSNSRSRAARIASWSSPADARA